MVSILYFSVVYLVVYLFVLFLLLKVFIIYLDEHTSKVLYGLLLINLIFVVFSTNTILDFRQFIILSTLFNSVMFLLALLLIKSLKINFFLALVVNYLSSSFLIFYYILKNYDSLYFLNDIRVEKNNYNNFFFFFIPLLSLGGVAPLVGFFFKFFFLVNLWSISNIAIFSAASITIIFTSVFYFQIFKNLFILRNKNFKNFIGDLKKETGGFLKITFLTFSMITLLGVFFVYGFVFVLTLLNSEILY